MARVKCYYARPVLSPRFQKKRGHVLLFGLDWVAIGQGGAYRVCWV